MIRMNHSTHLAVPVFSDTVEGLRAALLTAIDAGATLVEVRLDLCGEITDDDVRTAMTNAPPSAQLLLTYRSVAQGGECEEEDEARLCRIDRLAPWFDLIDVELDTWRSSERHRELVRQALVEPGERPLQSEAPSRRRLILSVHDFRGRPKSMQNDLLECVETPACDIVKIAWSARSVRDCLEAFEILRSCPKPAIAICMGAPGVVSRLLAPRYGAFATFASLDRQQITAPGQLTISELKTTYRWDALNEATSIFGVIGHPVSHSLSPATHNRVFSARGVNAVYTPLDVAPGYESLKAFLLEAESRPSAGFRGFSVTIPHKLHAMRFLQEQGGHIDAIAGRVGAINTLAFDPDGGWRGTNTDYAGALAAITTGLGMSPQRLAGIRATVLGAGGVSRAVIAALVDHGAIVTLSNRTEERMAPMRDEFGIQTAPWERRDASEADLIVNCTSVGMAPDTEATPWTGNAFAGGSVVFDTVYTPEETRLTRDAMGAGATVIRGTAMFAGQAAAQWAFWFGAATGDDAYERATRDAIDACATDANAPTDF